MVQCYLLSLLFTYGPYLTPISSGFLSLTLSLVNSLRQEGTPSALPKWDAASAAPQPALVVAWTGQTCGALGQPRDWSLWCQEQGCSPQCMMQTESGWQQSFPLKAEFGPKQEKAFKRFSLKSLARSALPLHSCCAQPYPGEEGPTAGPWEQPRALSGLRHRSSEASAAQGCQGPVSVCEAGADSPKAPHKHLAAQGPLPSMECISSCCSSCLSARNKCPCFSRV